MDENVTYQNNLVLVSAAETKSVIVYVRPTDTIRLPYDISKLEKKVVDGDLVISFYAGGKITIVNYGIMLAQGQVPTIVDAMGMEYTLDNLVLDNIAVQTTDDPDHYVVSRKISSADSDKAMGEELASAQITANAESDKEKFVGNIEIDQQNPVPSTESQTQPFELLTLQFSSKLRYDVDYVYPFTGRTMYDQEEPGTQPTPIQLVTPLLDAYYGAKVTNITTNVPHNKSNFVQVMHGGGDYLGTSGGADYMFTPENLNLGSAYNGSIYLKADDSNIITRGMQVALNGDNVSIREIRLEGLPEGVTIVATDDYQVQPFGTKVAVIKPLTQAKNIDIYFEYEVGMPETVAEIEMTITGFNSKYNSLLMGSKGIKWEFKPVNDEFDISNYNSLNVFTYSTKIDPLIISTGGADDYVDGGNGDHTYYLLAGNDTFVSGVGNETVILGDGSDEFYVGYGNDKVDGGRDIDTIYFINKIDINRDTKINLDSGIVNINVTDNTKATSYKTTLTSMDIIYLDDKDNVVEIGSTASFDDFKIMAAGANGGAAGSQHDKIILHQGTYIDFAQGYLTTVQNHNQGRIFFRSGNQETLDIFVGSGSGETIIGSKDYAFNYQGKGGYNILKYDDISGADLIFDAFEGSATKNGQNEDKFTDIKEVYGTQGNDIFYASGDVKGSGITYRSGGGNDTVTYEKEDKYGVTIDFTQTSVVTVSKSFPGSGTQSTDYLYDITTIKASQADDKFLVGGLGSSTYDGLNGKDELNYQTVNNNLIFNIANASGSVDKGGGNVDTFSNMEIFTGGKGDDEFRVSDANINLEFHGEGGTNLLSYEDVTAAVSYVLDFTSGSASKIDKFDSSGNSIGSDAFSSIQRFVTGNYNDTFKFLDQDQFDKLNIQELNAGASDNFTAGDRNSKGNVLEFTNPGEIDLITLASKIMGFNSLVLSGSGSANSVIVTAANSLQFSHIFGNTATENILDCNNINVGLTFDINAVDGITNVVIGSDSIYIFDFSTFVGTTIQDTFNITGKKDGSIYIKGVSGGDILNYGTTTGYLTFNLGDINGEYTGSVDKGDPAHLDRFNGINSIVGGDDGNLFILSADSNYTIQGGAGRDTVSFENSLAPITSLNFANYSSIEIYKLSNFDDVITFNPTIDKDLYVDAGNGNADSLLVDGSVDLVFNIGIVDPNDSSTLVSELVGTNGSNYFKNFEKINGSTGNDTFNVQNTDNKLISSNGRLYFMGNGGDDKADYSSITNVGVTVVIGGADPDNLSDLYIVVNKENGSGDYFDVLTNLILTGADDILQIDTATSYDYSGTTIDMGGGSNTLDFYASSGPIDLDIANNTLNGNSLTIINWQNAVGTVYTDVFHLNDGGDRAFDGKENFDTLDFVGVTKGTEIDIVNGKATYDDGKVDTFANIEKFVGSTANTVFKVAGNNNYTIVGQAGNTSNYYTLDYSLVDPGVTGFLFTIDAPNPNVTSGTVNKVINGSVYQDDFSEINAIVGSLGDDIFTVTLDSSSTASEISLDGEGGNNTLIVNLGAVSQGVTFDLINHQLLAGTTKKANIANFQTITGTDQDDNFIIDKSVLTQRGVLDGSIGNDTLDLTNITEDLTYNLALNSIFISTNQAATATVTNMEIVSFGSGNDTVIVSTFSGSTLTQIDGGGGTNSISFENLSSPIDSYIEDITVGNTSFKLVNFQKYKLTAFSDTIRVRDASGASAYSIDGHTGQDTIDYSGYTADPVVIDIADANNITATRGSITDSLENFEIFKLNDGGSVNIQIAGDYVLEGTGVNNTIGYSGYQGHILVDFLVKYIYKFDSATNSPEGIDQVSNFTHYIGTDQNDEFRLALLPTGITNIVIDTGKGADIIDLTNMLDPTNIAPRYAEEIDSNGNRMASISASSGQYDYIINLQNDSTPTVIGNSLGLEAWSMVMGTTFIAQESAGIDHNHIQYDADPLYNNAGVLVDFVTGTVSLYQNGSVVPNTPQDHFVNFYWFNGTAQDDKFVGLNSYTQYRIEDSSVGHQDMDVVDYSGCLVGITVTLDANGSATVNKGGIQDELDAIEGYAGSNNDDIFTIDISYFATAAAGAFIDGNQGTDTLEITGANSLQLEIDSQNNSTINGNDLIAKNFNIYTLTTSDDTFTYHSTANENLTVNGNGGNDEFTLDNRETGIVVVNMDFTSGVTTISSTYSLQITGFTSFNLKSADAITFNLNNADFTQQVSNYTVNFVNQATDNELRLNNASGLDKIDIGANISLGGSGGNIAFNNVSRLFVGAVANLSSNIAVNFDMTTANKNYSVGLNNSIDLTINGSSSATGNSIVFANGNIQLTDATYNHSFTFNDTSTIVASSITTNIADFKISGNNTIIPVGNLTFNGVAGKLDISGYGGAMGDITIGGTTTTNSNIAIDFNGNIMNVNGDSLESLLLPNKDNNVIIRNAAWPTATSPYTITGGNLTDTIIIAQEAMNGAGVDIAYDGSGSFLSNSNSGQINLAAFEVLDFSALNNLLGNSDSLAIKFVDNDINKINRVILPTTTAATLDQVHANIADFNATTTGLNGAISFLPDSATTSLILMQFQGSYANGNIDISNIQNIILPGSQDSSITFNYVSENELITILQAAVEPAGGAPGAFINIGADSGVAYTGGNSFDFSAWSASYYSNVPNTQLGENLLFFNIAATGNNNETVLGMREKAVNATPTHSIVFTGDNITLPGGSVYIESLPQISMTLTARNTLYQGDYVLFKVPTGGTLSVFNQTGDTTTGTTTYTSSGGSYTYTLNNVSMFEFDDQANTVVLGENGSLFETPKGRFYLDGPETAEDKTPAGTGSNPNDWDTIDLSNVAGGRYYFSMTNWSSVQYNNDFNNLFSVDPDHDPELAAGSTEFNAIQTIAYGTDDQKKHIQIGIGMVNYDDRDKITRPDLLETLPLFYAFKGVNKLIMTGGDDTFDIGKFYNWANPANNNKPYVDSLFKVAGNFGTGGSATYTKLKEVDGAGGNNTLNVDPYYYGLNSYDDVNNSMPIRVDRAWKWENDVIDYTPGIRNHYESGMQGMVFKNFKILNIDDIGIQTAPDKNGNLWNGMDDDIIMYADTFSGNYYEVNLGGRGDNLPQTITNSGAGGGAATIDTQTITFNYSKATIITWGADPNRTVDSVLNLRTIDGSSYVFKNFDEFIYHNSASDSVVLRPVNRSSLINGKTYTLDLDSNDTVTYYLLTGWTVNQSKDPNGNTLLVYNYNNNSVVITFLIKGATVQAGVTPLNEGDIAPTDDNSTITEDTNSTTDNSSNSTITTNGDREHTWWDEINTNNGNSQSLNVNNHHNGTLTLTALDDTANVKHSVGDIFQDINTIDYVYNQTPPQEDAANNSSTITDNNHNTDDIAHEDNNQIPSIDNPADTGQEDKPSANNNNVNNNDNSDLNTNNDTPNNIPNPGLDNDDNIPNQNHQDNDDLTASVGNIDAGFQKPNTPIVNDNLTKDKPIAQDHNGVKDNVNKAIEDVFHQDGSILDFDNQNSNYDYALHTENHNTLDLAKLFATVEENNNDNPSLDLQSTINTINSISEDLIHSTQKLDELDSISYALEDSHTSGNDEVNIAHSKKHNNDNGGNFGGN